MQWKGAGFVRGTEDAAAAGEGAETGAGPGERNRCCVQILATRRSAGAARSAEPPEGAERLGGSGRACGGTGIRLRARRLREPLSQRPGPRAAVREGTAGA